MYVASSAVPKLFRPYQQRVLLYDSPLYDVLDYDVLLLDSRVLLPLFHFTIGCFGFIVSLHASSECQFFMVQL